MTKRRFLGIMLAYTVGFFHAVAQGAMSDLPKLPHMLVRLVIVYALLGVAYWLVKDKRSLLATPKDLRGL